MMPNAMPPPSPKGGEAAGAALGLRHFRGLASFETEFASFLNGPNAQNRIAMQHLALCDDAVTQMTLISLHSWILLRNTLCCRGLDHGRDTVAQGLWQFVPGGVDFGEIQRQV